MTFFRYFRCLIDILLWHHYYCCGILTCFGKFTFVQRLLAIKIPVTDFGNFRAVGDSDHRHPQSASVLLNRWISCQNQEHRFLQDFAMADHPDSENSDLNKNGKAEVELMREELLEAYADVKITTGEVDKEESAENIFNVFYQDSENKLIIIKEFENEENMQNVARSLEKVSAVEDSEKERLILNVVKNLEKSDSVESIGKQKNTPAKVASPSEKSPSPTLADKKSKIPTPKSTPKGKPEKVEITKSKFERPVLRSTTRQTNSYRKNTYAKTPVEGLATPVSVSTERNSRIPRSKSRNRSEANEKVVQTPTKVKNAKILNAKTEGTFSVGNITDIEKPTELDSVISDPQVVDGKILNGNEKISDEFNDVLDSEKNIVGLETEEECPDELITRMHKEKDKPSEQEKHQARVQKIINEGNEILDEVEDKITWLQGLFLAIVLISAILVIASLAYAAFQWHCNLGSPDEQTFLQSVVNVPFKFAYYLSSLFKKEEPVPLPWWSRLWS